MGTVGRRIRIALLALHRDIEQAKRKAKQPKQHGVGRRALDQQGTQRTCVAPMPHGVERQGLRAGPDVRALSGQRVGQRATRFDLPEGIRGGKQGVR